MYIPTPPADTSVGTYSKLYPGMLGLKASEFWSALVIRVSGRPYPTVAQKGQSQISYKNTKQFPKTQINFPKNKSISQNTNQFLKTRTSLPKHKPISRNTNKWTGYLLCNYQREPGRDSFPGISASNMATSSCE